MKKSKKQYDVALSFAGEDRCHAEALARMLEAANISVFYDGNEQSELWGEDLYTNLAEIYSNKSTYCVMFLSRYYAKKSWTNHERRFAQERALNEKNGYILPRKIDDTDIQGIPSTVAHIDLRKTTIEQVFKILIRKIQLAREKNNESNVDLFRISESRLKECMSEYNSNISENPSDSDSLFMLGKSYLRLKLYDFSIKYFEKSLELIYDNPDYYYYYALSLIKGRRIKSMRLSEIKQTQKLVDAAIKIESKSKYYYLSAIINHDYYVSNGLRVMGLSFDQLIAKAKTATKEHGEIEIIFDNIIFRDVDVMNMIVK